MPQNQPPQKPLNEYSRWSGLTFRMIGIIVLFTLGGHYADGYFRFQNPYITIVAAIVATGLAFYMLIREAIRK